MVVEQAVVVRDVEGRVEYRLQREARQTDGHVHDEQVREHVLVEQDDRDHVLGMYLKVNRGRERKTQSSRRQVSR